MSSIALRIAYFGLPFGALALARHGVTPRIIVLGHTDAPGTRRVRALGSELLVKPNLEEAKTVASIEATRPDVILSWFYPRQIPQGVLDFAARGAFGTHPSLLPRWRGPDPYFWALYSGDAETGVSLHRLEAAYDTGAVVAQRRVAIDPRENAWRLAKRLDRPALSLLLECASRLAAGEALVGTRQDETCVTLAPAPDDALLAIDWQGAAADIVRLVRAAAPFPAASAELGDETVDVLDAEVYARPLPRALEPADAVWTPDGLVVRAGDVGVRVLRVRDPDDHILTGAALETLFPGALARVHF